MKELNSVIAKKKIRTEILGLSGVGKTTVVKKLKERNEDILTSIPVKNCPFIIFKCLISNIVNFFRIYIKTKNIRLVKSFFYFKVCCKIIEDSKSGKFNLYKQDLILDQSVIYHSILGLKEQYIIEKELIKQINRVSFFFPIVILLTCPEEIIASRIRKRSNRGIGRAKDLSNQELKRFLKDYSDCFNVLKKTNLTIVEIDTSVYTAEEVVEKINTLLDVPSS